MKLSTLAAVAPVVAMLLAMGCASSELVQPAVVAPPAFAFTNVDGYDFYEDSASGELIPPSSGPRAHIERETSVVVMNCDVDQCNAAYKSEHFGMWHKTSQTMHWSLQDFSGADLGGGEPNTNRRRRMC